MPGTPHLTRRRLLTGGLALGTLTLLAACGASAPATAPAGTVASTAAATSTVPVPVASPTPAASAAAVAATGTRATTATSPPSTVTRPTGVASPAAGDKRTITTAHGSLVVPAKAQRIVSVDFFSPLVLLDLGVTPVGVINYSQAFLDLNLPKYRPILTSLPKVGTASEADAEAIAVLKPDLIIGWGNEVKVYDQLRPLAPAAFFVYEWASFPQQVATAAGLTAANDALVKQYEARAAAIKQTYAAVLGRTRFAIVASGGASNWIMPHPNGTNAMGALALAGMQFVPAQAGLTAAQNLSFEQVSLLADADVILYPASPEGKPSASLLPLLDQPLFKALKAAQAGHLYPLSYYNSGHHVGTLGALDTFEAALKKL